MCLIDMKEELTEVIPPVDIDKQICKSHKVDMGKQKRKNKHPSGIYPIKDR